MRRRPSPIYESFFDFDSTPTADEEVKVQLAASPGVTHVIHWIGYSYKEAVPTTGNLQVLANSVELLNLDISAEKDDFIELGDFPIYGNEGEAVDIVLAAGGTGAKGTVEVCYS